MSEQSPESEPDYKNVFNSHDSLETSESANDMTWHDVINITDIFSSTLHWNISIPKSEYAIVCNYMANKFNKDASKFYICCDGTGISCY